MQVSHLGHASLLIESDTTRVLIDPGGLSDGWHDLADLSMIVVTHRHADHVDVERLPALVAANPQARVVGDAASMRILADHDIAGTAMETGDQVRAGDLTLTGHATPHARIHDRITQISNLGVVIEQDAGARILHPGDALEPMPLVDVVALPTSAPWASIAMLADWVNDVGAPTMVPIHDALLSPAGRAIHLRLLQELTDGIVLADLSDGSRLTL